MCLCGCTDQVSTSSLKYGCEHALRAHLRSDHHSDHILPICSLTCQCWKQMFVNTLFESWYYKKKKKKICYRYLDLNFFFDTDFMKSLLIKD